MKKGVVVIQCYNERNSSLHKQVNGNKTSVRDRVQNIDTVRCGQNTSPQPILLSDNSDSLTWSSKRSSFDQSSSVSSGSSSGGYGQPPPCPTPDYDSSSVASSMSVTSSADSSKYLKESQSEVIRTNGLPKKSPLINGTPVLNPIPSSMKNPISTKGSSGNGTVILQKSVSSTTVSVKTNSVNIKPTSSVISNGSAKQVGSSVLIKNSKVSSRVTNDGVEMESLESFELANPSNPDPKPPETYFPKRRPLSSTASSPKSTLSTASTGTAGRKARPVSVTIGEYPSGTTRREPSKFSFLSGTEETDNINGPSTDRLQSELMRTLNRSDLKRRTEQEGTSINGSATAPNSATANVAAAAKGTVTVSVNSAPLKSPPGRLFDGNGGKVSPSAAPAIRSVAEKLNGTLGGANSGNRVTIRVGSEPTDQQ